LPVTESKEKLTEFSRALIDQHAAKIVVPAIEAAPGFWFGGGNLIEDDDGSLFLVGRFRDAGDSRTGLAVGRRGWELAIFKSQNQGQSFEKIVQFSKDDLTIGDQTVLSIEGSALLKTENGVELFVSCEKNNVGLPANYEEFIKPGTGVWSIDRLHAKNVADLQTATTELLLSATDPQFLHVKDPFVYNSSDGKNLLLFCSHPFSWSSSNTGYTVRQADTSSFEQPVFDFFPRGFTWDVAMTRGTCVLDVPRVGPFAERQFSLMFYDGGECVRDHHQHTSGIHRPRGYSCEELGGVAFLVDGDFDKIDRLSVNFPLFVSPYGTGCSRYVDVLETADGFYATWQQAQSDGSQPLVMNFLSQENARAILT
jgi:hypothetical protein